MHTPTEKFPSGFRTLALDTPLLCEASNAPIRDTQDLCGLCGCIDLLPVGSADIAGKASGVCAPLCHIGILDHSERPRRLLESWSVYSRIIPWIGLDLLWEPHSSPD